MQIARYLIIYILCATSPLILADTNTFRATLLGTGNPIPSIHRFGNSTLIEAGNQRLLFDFGRGTIIRIKQLGYSLNSISAGFITHFHSDHTTDLLDYMSTSWLTPDETHLQRLPLYGPKGTQQLATKLEDAFTQDRDTRSKDENLPTATYGYQAHDVAPGIIYQKEGVTVTAFNNHHGDLIKPSYGYAIEYQGKKIIISGDTTAYPAMAKNYQNADLIIHEVAAISPTRTDNPKRYISIKNHHISPQEAGTIFSQIKPKLAIYSHIIYNGGENKLNNYQVNQQITKQTRQTYKGPLLIGSDLMTIDLSENSPAIYYNQ